MDSSGFFSLFVPISVQEREKKKNVKDFPRSPHNETFNDITRIATAHCGSLGSTPILNHNCGLLLKRNEFTLLTLDFYVSFI